MKKHALFLFFVVCTGLIYGQPKFHSVPKQNMQALNLNNPTIPSVMTLPTHPLEDFDLSTDDNPEYLSTMNGDYQLCSAYPGFTPVFAHQIVNDKAGNLLFFIVDNYIYNKNGYGFENNQLYAEGVYHVLKDGNYNPYETCNENVNRLHNDIIVVPVIGSCNEFYIFYATLHCETAASIEEHLPHIFVKKLTYINENEIELTAEVELNNSYFSEACWNYSGFSMDITPYDENYGNQLLVIQWQGKYEIFEIANVINPQPKFLQHGWKSDNAFGAKRPDAVISLLTI